MGDVFSGRTLGTLSHSCKDLGTVFNLEKSLLKPINRGSVSQDNDKHHLGEGLSSGLSNCQALGSGGQLFLSCLPCKYVAGDLKPHGFSGIVHSRGQGQDATPSVATEVALSPIWMTL